MEALSNYLKTLTIGGRLFVSNPPGPALLIWTNRDFLPNISGISIVEQEGAVVSEGVQSEDLFEMLKAQVYGTVPVLHIIYKKDMSGLSVDGKYYSLADAAQLISERFHIAIGNNRAKAPNNPEKIKDPFHVWSREAFDGQSVMKTDIDFLTTSSGRITTIWEVKRSMRIKVGIWKPYIDPTGNNDINNYLMLMSFANLLKASMITIHHEQMDENEVLTGEELVDIYRYIPGPNQSMLNDFGRRKPNTSQRFNEAFKVKPKT